MICEQNDKTTAVILAAGSGSRMGADITKQRMMILGKSMLWHTVNAFEKCADIHSIVVVVRADELEFAHTECDGVFSKVVSITCGGKNRAESAKCGLTCVPRGTRYIAVHDGARCLITPQMISQVVTAARRSGAASATAPMYDTVKRIDSEGRIIRTEDRVFLCRALTPQVFDIELYKQAFEKIEDISALTDDNMLLEAMGLTVTSVSVGGENIKVTTPSDLEYAEFLLKRRIENV